MYARYSAFSASQKSGNLPSTEITFCQFGSRLKTVFQTRPPRDSNWHCWRDFQSWTLQETAPYAPREFAVVRTESSWDSAWCQPCVRQGHPAIICYVCSTSRKSQKVPCDSAPRTGAFLPPRHRKIKRSMRINPPTRTPAKARSKRRRSESCQTRLLNTA